MPEMAPPGAPCEAAPAEPAAPTLLSQLPLVRTIFEEVSLFSKSLKRNVDQSVMSSRTPYDHDLLIGSVKQAEEAVSQKFAQFGARHVDDAPGEGHVLPEDADGLKEAVAALEAVLPQSCTFMGPSWVGVLFRTATEDAPKRPNVTPVDKATHRVLFKGELAAPTFSRLVQ